MKSIYCLFAEVMKPFTYFLTGSVYYHLIATLQGTFRRNLVRKRTALKQCLYFGLVGISQNAWQSRTQFSFDILVAIDCRARAVSTRAQRRKTGKIVELYKCTAVVLNPAGSECILRQSIRRPHDDLEAVSDV